jgi:hydro-lyases, Fe-S type, tartrate/fumarate subfamily, beta region
MKSYNTEDIRNWAPFLTEREQILLSGTVYTARDAAHKRLVSMIERGENLPFQISGATIYYAGPTPAKPGAVIGSCGPTTSSRMDVFMDIMLNQGLCCTIGKGERSPEVADSIRKHGAVYLCAIGGAGALASACITACEIIAFDDLGCESIKKLTFKKFPLIVSVCPKQ